MTYFSHKRVIVTGGSRGIGFAVAEGFYKGGAEVALVARDEKELIRAKEQLGTERVYMLTCDVGAPDAGQKVADFIKNEWHGQVDVLVNAAGIYGPKGKLEDNDFSEWKKAFEVNVFGTVQMCQSVLPFMKKNKFGRIVNFSGGGEGAFPNFTAYSSSKGAILRFTESLAAEVEGDNITVNAIAPGAVNTALMEEVLEAGPEKVGKEFYARSLEQKKSGGAPPEKATELVLYLAREESGFITGKMLSAIHDNWREFGKHKEEIESSDVYNFRRIKPKEW